MPVNNIAVHHREDLHRISQNTLPRSHTDQKNNLLSNISGIKNSVQPVEISEHRKSRLSSTINYLRYIKNKIWPLPLTDTKLNNVLSQGRALTYDLDNVHRSLNNDILITRPSFSSTNKIQKKEIVLGGMLLGGAIAGGGIYYFQRTGHESRGDMPSASLAPYRHHSPLHDSVYPVHLASERKNNIPSHKNNPLLAMKKHITFDAAIVKPGKKIKQNNSAINNRAASCPSINRQQKKR